MVDGDSNGGSSVGVSDRPTVVLDSSEVPARRAGSVRRTTTVDITPPFAPDDPVVLVAEGRDLLTDRDGRSSELGAARLSATLAYTSPGREILALDTSPGWIDTSGLVGAATAAGFRRTLAEAVPPEATGTVLFLMLDDIPVATILAGAHLLRPGQQPIRLSAPPIGTCAGWASGGQLEQRVLSGIPLAVVGPVPPPASSPDDPLAWHPVTPLAPNRVRRRRRVDLIAPSEPGAPLALDAMFRDTYGEADGRETVIHEYSIRATVHAENHTVLTIVAQPHVLPGQQCPLAAGFVHRLVGVPLEGVRVAVGRELRGTDSCTHLNDALRSISDLAGMIGVLLPH